MSAAPSEEDDKVTPRGYIVRLPPTLDEDGRIHRAHITLFLYGPQAAVLNAEPLMYADGFVVRRDGLQLYLPTGAYRECPKGWVDAFDAIGLTGSYTGLAGLAALKLVSKAMKRHRRKRGERGPNKAHLHARDFLLAAALACIAKGMSQRKAVCHVIAEHEDVVPWPFASAEDALLKLVKRQLSANRLFVPSPSEPMR